MSARDSLGVDRYSRLLESKPGLIEGFYWWLAPQIDKVWRKTIRLQRTRFWRIPYVISRSSDYVAAWAMWRLMDRLDRAGNE